MAPVRASRPYRPHQSHSTLAASVEKVAKLVSEAKSNGAQLVVLPEAFLTPIRDIGVRHRR